MKQTINEQNFLEFYDQHVTKIYRYIYFRVGSEPHAQDLTSEVFLRYWRYLCDKSQRLFRGQGLARALKNEEKRLENPRAFLYQIARNLVVDFYRQNNKAPLYLEEITDKKIADRNSGPQEQTEKFLELEAIKGALAYLNNDYQEIIIWRYLDELEIKEISEILDKSEGAVRVLLSRALNSLKAVLSETKEV